MNQYFGDPDDCYDRKDHDEFKREHPCNDSVFKDIFERSAMEVEEEENDMEELKVANGGSVSRDIEIKIVPCCLQAAQDGVNKNYEVKRIIARRKSIRKNLFCYTYGTVTFFGMILSVLCMSIAPLNGTIGFCVFTALFGAFIYSNREVL